MCRKHNYTHIQDWTNIAPAWNAEWSDPALSEQIMTGFSDDMKDIPSNAYSGTAEDLDDVVLPFNMSGTDVLSPRSSRPNIHRVKDPIDGR